LLLLLLLEFVVVPSVRVLVFGFTVDQLSFWGWTRCDLRLR
jgi:hypothetical protein